MAFEFEHSVECPVARDFAWRFWADVSNWPTVDPSVEAARLDGPFAAGTKGTTKPRGLPPTQWTLVEVREGRSAVIEVSAPGAVLRFGWVFEDAAGGGTRMIQKVSLEGARAGEYAEGMKGLEAGIPAGMRGLAAAMSRAAGESRTGVSEA